MPFFDSRGRVLRKPRKVRVPVEALGFDDGNRWRPTKLLLDKTRAFAKEHIYSDGEPAESFLTWQSPEVRYELRKKADSWIEIYGPELWPKTGPKRSTFIYPEDRQR